MTRHRFWFRLFLSAVSANSVLLPGQVREKRVVPADQAQSEHFGQRRSAGVAVLVGVAKYPRYSGLNVLKYPGRDVDRVKLELESQRYTVLPLKDEEATREAVLGAIREAGEVLDQKTGVMIFFFSGHGFAVNGSNYLATFDSSRERLAESGLSISTVEQALTSAGARRRALWIDACRNDLAAKGAREARSFAGFAAAEGTRILFSTKAGNVSWEDDELKQGVFSFFLQKGLQGAAARDDGFISFRDLADFVTNEVQNRSLHQGRVQIPYEGGESTRDFLVAVARAPDLSVPPEGGPPEPGKDKVNYTDGQRYVWIPSGHFMMGCSVGDTECHDDEKPTHEVTLTKGFWIGRTDTTVAAWARYAKKTGGNMPLGTDSFGRKFNAQAGNDSLPVVSVDFREAQAFCQWAGMRLPSEAEWEYAARAENVRARYGNPDEIAWYGDNSGSKRMDTTRLWREEQQSFNLREYENGNGPRPVGQKLPNAWNLLDMLGNVWQWTADWYGERYYGHVERADPTGPLGGDYRVLRGGSWVNFPRLVRVSYRERYEAGARHNNVGFRCAGNSLPEADQP